jgi:cation diffusion facilitator CzcD-associated flavoprotein CzcO
MFCIVPNPLPERPCLEQNWYEVLDQDNVTIVDISEKSGNEIVEFTENGLKTSDGKVYECDVLAFATGFDITTGTCPSTCPSEEKY